MHASPLPAPSHTNVSLSAVAGLSLLLLSACGGGDGEGSSTDSGGLTAPIITSFAAAKNPVTTDTATTLTAVFGNGTASIEPGIGPVHSGDVVSTGRLSADTTFTLTVTGNSSTRVASQVTVRVVPATTIASFAASPDILTAGQTSTLSWQTTGATQIRIDHGVGSVSGTNVRVKPATTTTYTLTATNDASDSVTRTVTVGVVSAALPRIHVDRTHSPPIFKDTAAQRFIPRGANYIRLDPVYGHATFTAKDYNRAAVETAFTTLEQEGYNIVRVFLDLDTDGISETSPLSPSYLDNFADFYLRATRHHIYLMPTFDWLPNEKHYWDLVQPEDPNITGANADVLHGPHVLARKAYAEDFIDGIAVRVAPLSLSTIFAYSLRNEMYLECSSLPFSSLTVQVTTANGKTYSMADYTERQHAADENSVYFANVLTDAIHLADPGSLVTVGAFSHQAVGKPGPEGLPIYPSWMDQRFPVRILALAQSSRLDFIDQHIYPLGAGYSFADDLRTIEWSSMPSSMPVIMGEFGAFKQFYSTIDSAVAGMKTFENSAWQAGFAGFLYWTFDTTEQSEIWTMLDGSGAILHALSPTVHPNPGALGYNPPRSIPRSAIRQPRSPSAAFTD